jgi:hypothetical protein
MPPLAEVTVQRFEAFRNARKPGRREPKQNPPLNVPAIDPLFKILPDLTVDHLHGSSISVLFRSRDCPSGDSRALDLTRLPPLSIRVEERECT